MFDGEDREQQDLDIQYVIELRAALKKAIGEADGWYDESRGSGLAPNLHHERMLLKVNIDLDDLI